MSKPSKALTFHFSFLKVDIITIVRSMQLIFMIKFDFLIWKSCDCVTPVMNNANSHVVMVTLFDSLLKIFPVVTSFAVAVDNSFMMTSMDTLTWKEKIELVSEIIINHNNIIIILNYY